MFLTAGMKTYLLHGLVSKSTLIISFVRLRLIHPVCHWITYHNLKCYLFAPQMPSLCSFLHRVWPSDQWTLRSIFTFWLFLLEENVSYQELFSEWKNYVLSQSYRILKSRKYIQLHCIQFNRDSRKSSLKSIFSYMFWDKCLKLVSHVLGTKKMTRILI